MIKSFTCLVGFALLNGTHDLAKGNLYTRFLNQEILGVQRRCRSTTL